MDQLLGELSLLVLLTRRRLQSMLQTLLSDGLPVGWIVRTLDNDRPAQAIRYVALAMLGVGFHFDLLVS